MRMNGKINGLRARGGFEVDIEWANGKLLQATIRATRDSQCRICANGKLSETIALKKGESKIWK